MMLIDSNIIIYASQPNYPQLRSFIAEHSPSVSAVSMVEVLGYHKLTETERTHFEQFFDAAMVHPISDEIVRRAIALRQLRKTLLGDSLIAATALVHNHTLATRNLKDFSWVPNLILLNPMDA